MTRFRDLKIKTKLAITFLVVLLPMMFAGGLAITSFNISLRDTAELELGNIVDHLYKLCTLQVDKGEKLKDKSTPDASDIEYISDAIMAFKVGHTGYPYIMNSNGTLIIHPEQTGKNIYNAKDSRGVEFIKQICENAITLEANEIGSIRYYWHNKTDKTATPRMKILKYRYFKKWDWIIAAGSYEEEIYEGLKKVEISSTILMIVSVILLIFLTFIVSGLIVTPLTKISDAATKMAAGDLSQTVEIEQRGDELYALAQSFNKMANQIRANTENLESLIHERTEELQVSREMYRSLVEGTVDGIVTTDISGKVTFVNSGMESMLGVSRAEVIGQKIWQFYKLGIDQAREVMKILRTEGYVTNYEMTLINSKGRVIPIRTSNSILLDSTGKERGSLGIFTDITSEKKLQKELNEAQSQIIQSMKMRALGDLVAGVAHEINNPLMAAGTMLHVISKKEQDDKNMSRRLSLIKTCHDRIAIIVNHLREFSRETTMEFAKLDIHVPLQNALMITSQQLLNLQIIVEKDFEENMPQIMGDTNHLEQVFLNLIGNARDAMENNTGDKILKVTTELIEADNKQSISISISDTGQGIPKEVQDKIFEPFFTTKEVGKGTGLGLSICYGLIEEHKGKIELMSSADKGTTFTIIIPLNS